MERDEQIGRENGVEERDKGRWRRERQKGGNEELKMFTDITSRIVFTECFDVCSLHNQYSA